MENVKWEVKDNKLIVGSLVTFNEIIDDGTDLTIQANGALKLAPDSDIIRFDFGTQDYNIGQRSGGTSLYVESATSGSPGGLQLFTEDGDSTDNNAIYIYGYGTVEDISNRERLIIGWDATDTQYEISTEAQGTGTLRDLVLYT